MNKTHGIERVWKFNGVEFNIGDKVRVMRQEEDFAPNGMGEGVVWENVWAATDTGAFFSAEERHMDAYLGMEFVIEDISEFGVEFESGGYDGYGYAFPLSSLDKIS